MVPVGPAQPDRACGTIDQGLWAGDNGVGEVGTRRHLDRIAVDGRTATGDGMIRLAMGRCFNHAQNGFAVVEQGDADSPVALIPT